jgi:TetR/AcrR family transcriptional repressor of nem operon
VGRPSTARARLITATLDLIWLGSYGAVSVDDICARAKVKKGSFYHFFRSKDQLVMAALEAHWQARRPVLDALFSPTVPPLERLRSYFQHVYHRQVELKRQYGRVVGCPFLSIGIECAQSSEIRAKVQEILGLYLRYYESALRDARDAGQLPVRDVRGKAKSLFAYMEGLLGQARVQDDAELVRDLPGSALRLLGLAERGRLAS